MSSDWRGVRFAKLLYACVGKYRTSTLQCDAEAVADTGELQPGMLRTCGCAQPWQDVSTPAGSGVLRKQEQLPAASERSFSTTRATPVVALFMACLVPGWSLQRTTDHGRLLWRAVACTYTQYLHCHLSWPQKKVSEDGSAVPPGRTVTDSRRLCSGVPPGTAPAVFLEEGMVL